MGVIVPIRKFSGENQAGLLKPIIYCCASREINEQAISMNQEIASALIKCRPRQRTMQLEKCFSQAVSKLPERPVIKDFDVLFNPDYKIDVLQMMINVCRSKPFSVIWPGRFEDGKLYYAEEGYQDYKIYDVDKYDVTCVI